MAAMREAKALGARVLSIVNVVGSAIAREADDVIYTWAGPEIAVATTKAYSTQLAVVSQLAIYMADQHAAPSRPQYTPRSSPSWSACPTKPHGYSREQSEIQHFASRFFNHNSIFFIGRNLDYATGMEGSLKLKEISYIHSEAYASGELEARDDLADRAGHARHRARHLCAAVR